MNYIKKIFYLVFMLSIPVSVSFAGIGNKPKTLKDIADTIIQIVNLLIPILISIALIAFFWGITKTIFNSDSEEARTTGKKIMIYGLLSIFVITSLWGILSLAQNTFF